MTKKRLLIAGGILAIPVLALAWWLGSPLFVDDEVNEDFPTPVAAATTDTTEAEPMDEEESMEEGDEGEMADGADGMDEEEAMDDGESMEDEMDEVEPTGPIALASGEFEDADASHQGSGSATFYELEDGSQVLRLEDFEVTNGPDLHVVLVPHDGSMDNSVNLGSLKGNIGDQNYEIPADVDISEFGSVWIYCVAFSVNFATASLG